jgi:hypothetical protein
MILKIMPQIRAAGSIAAARAGIAKLPAAALERVAGFASLEVYSGRQAS